jgi:sulfite reductase (NADPH) hemoprotein beta-component
MYQYNELDQKIIDERVLQFRGQTERYMAGELSEDQFLPLRLQNGLYVQRHAPMLRVAIPYGTLNSNQLRKLGSIARDYDKGYGHISTRQNMQFNWPALEKVPDILEELASVQMHAVQTSGNCIRNTTTDQFAGVTSQELEDPRPYCEIIRQWSTFHPEFAFLPRKFKIAVSAAKENDRAAVRLHDIGLYLVEKNGKTGFEVYVGGGLGRTPVVAPLIKPFLEKEDLISYLEAVLRVYNKLGRRDNKYKARVKILVRATGEDKFAEMVEAEWENTKDSYLKIPEKEFVRVSAFFKDPEYKQLENQPEVLTSAIDSKPSFKRWYRQNVSQHKVSGYAAVTLSLKQTGVAPGDITDVEMEAVADLAEEFSFSELRTTHDHNIVFPYVEQQKLPQLWEKLEKLGFACANIGLLNDVICCPGGDYCALANAKSIPIAEQVQRRFEDLDYLYDLGNIDLNISGCMNACGHHHIGHIGILGVDKKGEEFYQVSLGGDASNAASLGKIIGPAFHEHEIAEVIEKIINVFVEKRIEGESFLYTYRRIGIEAFKGAVYANTNKK